MKHNEEWREFILIIGRWNMNPISSLQFSEDDRMDRARLLASDCISTHPIKQKATEQEQKKWFFEHMQHFTYLSMQFSLNGFAG
jgi:hypothetical protein